MQVRPKLAKMQHHALRIYVPNCPTKDSVLDEYYCYYKNMLVIYKFTKNLVDPMDNYHDDKISVLHLPYVFKDMPENETK